MIILLRFNFSPRIRSIIRKSQMKPTTTTGYHKKTWVCPRKGSAVMSGRDKRGRDTETCDSVEKRSG